MKMWIVSEEEMYCFDIIGAADAESAAKVYVAAQKKARLEEIEEGKERYKILREQGLIDDPWEQSGFPVNLVLPQEVKVTPMKDPTGYRDNVYGGGNKYDARALRDMFDWDKTTRVRL